MPILHPSGDVRSELSWADDSEDGSLFIAGHLYDDVTLERTFGKHSTGAVFDRSAFNDGGLFDRRASSQSCTYRAFSGLAAEVIEFRLEVGQAFDIDTD